MQGGWSRWRCPVGEFVRGGTKPECAEPEFRADPEFRSDRVIPRNSESMRVTGAAGGTWELPASAARAQNTQCSSRSTMAVQSVNADLRWLRRDQRRGPGSATTPLLLRSNSRRGARQQALKATATEPAIPRLIQSPGLAHFGVRSESDLGVLHPGKERALDFKGAMADLRPALRAPLVRAAFGALVMLLALGATEAQSGGDASVAATIASCNALNDDIESDYW
jgi:hypothetical protein